MLIQEWVWDRGGIVRSTDLRRAGWSGRALSSAVAHGILQRPRNGWLAVPSVDPHLFAAARAGVVLTCVTEAARLGLWVLEVDRPHVAAPPHSGTVRIEVGSDGSRKATVHWNHPVVPRHPGALVDPIENVLATVAVCRPHEEALAIWESALNRGMVDSLALKRLPFTGRARQLREEASPYSDSGLESFVVPRLRWMRLRIVPQAWLAGRPVDFLIGERLVLQIDGGHHVGPQREADIAHDARLMLMGYHVIRVGYGQVVDDWPGVQALIMRAVAEGLHRAT
ncbi:type IV toxin-antitoxin system AbiEi family antitoxin domain-containing protein [Microbacterium sp. NPDC019599]|uniref:type IV toxin-antitoxin system AbiEi family antitoxin domain-containing protein n=1 Tax=Microbacterium sp. NPDC019599 TaxID=3154690 RepID=UPI0033FDF1CE